MEQIRQKVVAYITRPKNGIDELLVFEHRDFPAAGLQVPAGTVETDEEIERALHREIAEESGLTGLRLVRKLGQTNEWRYGVHRHFFHLEAASDLPDRWDWTTNDFHDDSHRRRNEPLVFSYRWITLSDSRSPHNGSPHPFAKHVCISLDVRYRILQNGHISAEAKRSAVAPAMLMEWSPLHPISNS